MSRAQDNPDKAQRPTAGAGGQGGAGRGLGPAAPAQKIALPSVTGKKPSGEAGKAVCPPALPGRELRKPSPASAFKEAVKEVVKMDKAVAAAAAQKAQAPPKPLPPPQPPTLGQDRKKASLVTVPVPQVAVKPKIVASQPPAKLAQEPAKSKPQPTKDRREGKELTRGTLTQRTTDVTRHDHEEGEVTVKENEGPGRTCATASASIRSTKSCTETVMNVASAPRTASSHSLADATASRSKLFLLASHPSLSPNIKDPTVL
ncbi:WAS/WASL-interacting protein family member 3-like [Dermacentor silvarum]|uniref:WAS/WASL-interacting protein family member 3-like n=1 Tax=Dermacentor silvarum TaxID=543639 RepID=UPI002101181A|nr:WAS/WASL-interacting protein family member 3-like [Dermacentor silvarum]